MQGRVSTDTFLEKLAELSPLKRISISDEPLVREISTDIVQTTSEQVIQRLKKLKDRMIFRDDMESVEDINW
jgi:hypothetical protein